MQIDPPTTANALGAFLEVVWDGTMEAGPDGATVLTHPDAGLYARFHDARRTAAFFGFRRLWGAGGGSGADVWEAPDGTRLWIGTDGGWVTAEKRRNRTWRDAPAPN